MNESVVVCRVPGCPSFGVGVAIITDEIPPVNVRCGPCGNKITDITPVD